MSRGSLIGLSVIGLLLLLRAPSMSQQGNPPNGPGNDPAVVPAPAAAPGAAAAPDSGPGDPLTLPLFTEGKLYLGKHETGLYPGGGNEMPDAHRQAGLKLAATIQPLDASGKPDGESGKVVALVLGHSNAHDYFSTLQRHFQRHAGQLRKGFELLDAAGGGQQLPEIRPLKGPVWNKAAQLLARPGYSPRQVQVLFLHTTYHGAHNGGKRPPGPFPQTMQKMRQDLAAVLEHCARIYPDLKIAYLTCDGFRHYTGFEPHVWQEAFAVKWLIQDQIQGKRGDSTLSQPDAGGGDGSTPSDTAASSPADERKSGISPSAGSSPSSPSSPSAGSSPSSPSSGRLPWLCWGPYIWDNTWDRSYFNDGVHPAAKSKEIFVAKYAKFLMTDPVAKAWLLPPQPAEGAATQP